MFSILANLPVNAAGTLYFAAALPAGALETFEPVGAEVFAPKGTTFTSAPGRTGRGEIVTAGPVVAGAVVVGAVVEAGRDAAEDFPAATAEAGGTAGVDAGGLAADWAIWPAKLAAQLKYHHSLG